MHSNIWPALLAALAVLTFAGIAVHEGRNIDLNVSSFGLLGIQLKTEDSARKNP